MSTLQEHTVEPDRNLEGVREFISALLLGQPIWPNPWGQDVAAAAFFLTDGGKRSTWRAAPTPAIDPKLPAAASILVATLERIRNKCRPGYMVSKFVVDWISEATAIAKAVDASLATQGHATLTDEELAAVRAEIAKAREAS